ncbi:MAG TPA: undecaprenyl-phosphate glucose phosphotransferase [Vineibacter sp.]|nr:undecaprenyl-phosphate glucose phosphotransferase [Vineibacter sp.]
MSVADAPPSGASALSELAGPLSEPPARPRKTVSAAIVTRLLMMTDCASILFAGLAAVRSSTSRADMDWSATAFVIVLGTVLSINAFHLVGAYKFAKLNRLVGAIATVALGWLLSLGILVLIAAVAGASITPAQPWLALWFAGGLSLLVASRLVLNLLFMRWKRDGRLGERVAVLGTGSIARRLLMHLNGRSGDTIRIVGLYEDRREEGSDGLAPAARCLGHPIAGDIDDLVDDIRRLGITSVIVALPLSADLRLAAALNKLSLVPVDVRLCPDDFGLQLGTVDVSHVGDVTLINVMERPLRDWRRVAKEIEDRVLAAMILALISPLMLAVAALIKLDSPGPVFFRQKRYGFNNRLIEVWKFRSMYVEAQDANAEQLTRRNDPRVTRIGAFLRRTSMDELPQFFNVLRGEMSIVGPRPHALAAKAGRLLYQDAVRYYDARHRMKPGITGWAQINGWRGETDTVEQIRKRVEHDLYYIENWSIALDLKIILRTVFGGFTGRYAY